MINKISGSAAAHHPWLILISYRSLPPSSMTIFHLPLESSSLKQFMAIYLTNPLLYFSNSKSFSQIKYVIQYYYFKKTGPALAAEPV